MGLKDDEIRCSRLDVRSSIPLLATVSHSRLDDQPRSPLTLSQHGTGYTQSALHIPLRFGGVRKSAAQAS